jgi:hypothetical protein
MKTSHRSLSFAVAVLAAALLAGCDRQSRGFALPPGDSERGQAVFAELGCHHCHVVTEQVAKAADSPYPEVTVRLGGTVSRVKTYGELVTAIIHPQKSLARGHSPQLLDEAGGSKMPDFNARMTVQELVDLTTFLQGQYSVYVPEYYPYIAIP